MANQPEITFIICTYNRADYLDETLHSLLRHEYSTGRFEILIVDNNSTDRTAGIARKYIEEYDGKKATIRCVEEQQQGLSHARNRGIREAAAPNIVFADDDIRAGGQFIPAWLAFFREHPELAAAGGRIHVQFEDPRPRWMSHFLLPLLGHHDLGGRQKAYPRHKYPFGGNMGFRKALFHTFGPFDADLGRKGEAMKAGEEKELFQRLRKQRKTIWYLPEAFLYHRVGGERLSLDYIRKQAVGLGNSMRHQLRRAAWPAAGTRWTAEIGKILVSLPLALGYALAFQPAKAKVLLQFRWWILRGYFGTGRPAAR